MYNAMNCYYCDLIAASDATYRPRPAEYDTGSEAPRCAWHWRFICDHCGMPGHFMTRFFCPNSRRMLCREAGQFDQVPGGFWAWQYGWVLHCQDCGSAHPSLDRAEHTGAHPWQVDVDAASAQRWLSQESQLTRYPLERVPRVPLEQVTDNEVAASWSGIADKWDAGYDERGDFNRKYLSDPVLLEFLGNVQGQRVLDAGCGAGYLSRLLARRSARVVGVELAPRFHEIALQSQDREPLGIEYHRGSIAHMPFLSDASFDAAVANYVLIDVADYEAAIREVARVLKPGGRFVYTVCRNTLNGAWHRPAHDSPRREDCTAWKDDDYFIRGAGLVPVGPDQSVISFDRPMRDYVAACKRFGLELRDIDEPEPSEEAWQVLPMYRVRQNLRIPNSFVIKCVKVG